MCAGELKLFIKADSQQSQLVEMHRFKKKQNKCKHCSILFVGHVILGWRRRSKVVFVKEGNWSSGPLRYDGYVSG